MKYRCGLFNHDGTEFVVTNPDTPCAFGNFLWIKSRFSNVQQTGLGYFEIRISNPDGIQKGEVEIVVDGESIEDHLLPTFEDDRIH